MQLAAQPYVAPTKYHKELARDEGVWDAEVSMWVSPDSEPLKSKAVERNKMLGEMWLMGEFEGEFAGQPFQGRSATGYDPIKKKYVGGWLDTVSPFMWMMEGDYDVESHTLTMMGQGVDAMTGKTQKSKMITRYRVKMRKSSRCTCRSTAKRISGGRQWKQSTNGVSKACDRGCRG
jgi:hypothetical protein